MPNCFQLFKKSEPTVACRFCDVDDEMCAHFGVTPDPVKYYLGWYDVIGLGIALGQSWDKMRDIHKDWPEILPLIDYLEANYNTNAWYEIRRRD